MTCEQLLNAILNAINALKEEHTKTLQELQKLNKSIGG